jgi:hypothetical protein
MVVEVVVKALTGRVFVLLFSALSEAVSPKLLAGTFAAAPAVALAGLLVTVVFKTADAARASSVGMLGGAAAISVYSIAVTRLVRGSAALRASLLALPAWFAVAFAVYFAALS